METPDVPDLSFPFKHAISCNIQVQTFVQTARKSLNDVTALLSESKIATAPAEDSFCCLVRGVKIGDQLRDAVAVAQVYECHRSEVAHLLHPAGEGCGFSYVGGPELAASVGSVHNYEL